MEGAPPFPESIPLLRPVTEAEVQQYQDNGVVLLKAIYPTEWLEYLSKAMDAVFDREAPSIKAASFREGKSTSGIRTDLGDVFKKLDKKGIPAALDDPDLVPKNRSVIETDTGAWCDAAFVHHTRSPLGEIVAKLTKSAQVTYYCDQMFLKEAGSNFRTPFHMDAPYFLMRADPRDNVAVCWVPLDKVTRENGAMQYFRGSQKWGKTFAPSDFASKTGSFPGNEDLEDLPTYLASHPESESDLLTFEALPGDVIVHNWHTVHGSFGNISATSKRRAASVRFCGDGVVWEMKKSSPEPYRNTVQLQDGQPLSEEPNGRFPVVWPRKPLVTAAKL